MSHPTDPGDAPCDASNSPRRSRSSSSSSRPAALRPPESSRAPARPGRTRCGEAGAGRRAVPRGRRQEGDRRGRPAGRPARQGRVSRGRRQAGRRGRRRHVARVDLPDRLDVQADHQHRRHDPGRPGTARPLGPDLPVPARVQVHEGRRAPQEGAGGTSPGNPGEDYDLVAGLPADHGSRPADAHLGPLLPVHRPALSSAGSTPRRVSATA